MVGVKQFIQYLRELLATSDRPVEKLVAKGEAALADGQPVVAAMHLTEAYGILARMKDSAVIPFQLTIANLLIEAYTQQGDPQEIQFWKETVEELKRKMP